jgi:N6-L-threonylcarbamoyladenine synthase
MARDGNRLRYPLKIPMQATQSCDFSYAGLKNQFRIAVSKARVEAGLTPHGTNAPARQGESVPEPLVLPRNVQADLCASFQHTAFAHVEDRLHRALDYVDEEGLDVRSLVVVGGVASNKELRRRLLRLLEVRRERAVHEDNSDTEVQLIFPPLELCTDNGVMPAWAGVEKLLLGLSDEVEGQEVVARWPLGLPIVDVDGNSRVFRKRKIRKTYRPLSTLDSKSGSEGDEGEEEGHKAEGMTQTTVRHENPSRYRHRE